MTLFERNCYLLALSRAVLAFFKFHCLKYNGISPRNSINKIKYIFYNNTLFNTLF